MANPIIAAVAAIFLCVMGQAASAAPKTLKANVALPDCRAVGETRIKVPVWDGEFKNTSTPPLPHFKDFQVLYIDLFGEVRETGIACPTENPEKIYTLTAEETPLDIDGEKIDSGGTQVKIQAPEARFANGTCYISGFFMHIPTPGSYNGWVSFYFRSLDAFEVIKSNQFCLDQK
jgi:hypothetical protein